MAETPGRTAAPSLDWTDADLAKFLADAWDMPDPADMRVVGRLRIEDKGHGFLSDLHDARTGRKLRPVSPTSRVHESVFVHPRDVAEFTSRVAKFDYVVANVVLSPAEVRKKRGDALSCSVRARSMQDLSRLPDEWGLALNSIDGETAPLLLGIARQAIEAQLRKDAAGVGAELARARAAFAQEQARHEAQRRQSEERLRTLLDAESASEGRLRELRDEGTALEADIDRRRQELEAKLRNLEDLLRKRGERMVALDLIDRDDLDTLLPQQERADARIGHDFQEVLAGRFDRLAPYIQARLWKKNILYSQAQLRNFLALTRTHDLVVLAGDSGSGKTSLVRAVADSIGGRCTVIPVKPNWTGPEDLLGYYNPIERNFQPTPFLKALQVAASEPDIPHFVCLDEMNLARVEHYFADFLSLLEVRDSVPEIALYTSDEEHHIVVENGLFLTLEEEVRQRTQMGDQTSFTDLLKNVDANALLHTLGGMKDTESVLLHHARLRRSMSALLRTPRSIRFPTNVRIIGAVNIDETTHYLSPKVLDRVHVLRFRNPVLTDWDAVEAEVESFDADVGLPLKLSAEAFGQRTEYPAYDARADTHAAWLTRLARDFLDPLGLEFGLRAIRQSLGYMRAAAEAGLDEIMALDKVVQQKILPKMMLDTGRTDPAGRSRRDLLTSLRDELDAMLPGLQPAGGDETSVMALDRIIASLDGNNGIANYWLR